MSYQVWCGTPNEMGHEPLHTATTQTAAVKWARDHLEKLRPQATKFDRAALDRITSVREQMLQTPVMAPDTTRSWTFPYISVVYCIEIRNVPEKAKAKK
jgi:hypothetical protein